MISMDIAGEALTAGTELQRGAIAGAIVVSAAYLAGYAILKRSGSALCAFLMVLAAGALQFGWLGFLAESSAKLNVLLQGFFGAAAIVFLSSVAKVVRRNALLGGVMLAGALSLIGIGVMNLIGSAEGAGLMRFGLGAVGVTAVLLSVLQWNRDPTVRLLLPGALLAGLAPFSGMLFGGAGEAYALLPPALFAIGVIAASLVALAEENIPRVAELGLHEHGRHHLPETAGASFSMEARECESETDAHDLLSETQLAKVADYAGVAVWDWCPHGAHQTDSMPTLMGADSRAPFTPDAVKAFIHKDDLSRLEQKILSPALGDGSFDQVLKLHDGRLLRFRGARAVDANGLLERLVVFVESAADAGKAARLGAPTAAAALSAAQPAKSGSVLQHNNNTMASAFGDALARGEIATVFQPIVSLETGKVAGFETLARWPGEAGEPDRASAEELVRAAETSGKGAALARFVIDEAASFLEREIKAHGRRDVFVTLNLSFAQMRDPTIVGAVRKAMQQHRLPARALVLELTESQAIAEKGAAEIFRALRDAGAALAFDDFGSGFSSLNNLRKYAFDYLKIDKSFVDGLVKGNESGKIAQAIASLGKDLGLVVIAEGVETKETADAAKKIGCKLAQGYQFGMPAKASAPQAAAQDERELLLTAPMMEKKPRNFLWRGGLR